MPLLLIVEDHEDTRQMYAAFLSSSFEIVEAGDAEQALAILATSRPDLIITDVSLPGLDGLEFIARVRRHPETARIPVICVSGYGGERHDQRAQAAGCDRVLLKPCMPDALEQAAHELLRGGGAGSETT